MNDDEKFDAWLTKAASDYNQPPATVPREAMWQAIQPALGVGETGIRNAGQADARAANPGSSIANRWRWVPLAAAAAVLVVVSYQVGRSRGGPSSSSTPVMAQGPASRSDTALYSRATDQHLGRADALLTTFRSAVGSDSVDVGLNRWARELLADTRLLLDSPAATDPSRLRLLQDLELALAQIVQLSAAATPDDHEMVERSLQRGELLTRIRTAVPSTLSGT